MALFTRCTRIKSPVSPAVVVIVATVVVDVESNYCFGQPPSFDGGCFYKMKFKEPLARILLPLMQRVFTFDIYLIE